MSTFRPTEICAPSRLHFGLMSFNNPEVPQFGGVGLMLNQPGIRMTITPSARFNASGIHSERVESFAKRWQAFHQLESLPPCHLEVTHAPPQHVGLGTGTQLGLTTAAALSTCEFGGTSAAHAMALSVGRGGRSAIGTHGFDIGGLLFERGKLDVDSVSELDRRIDCPTEWRVVLVRPHEDKGLSGENERTAFRNLPPVPKSTTERLIDEVTNAMFPAVDSADFDTFAESVYRYGETAGLCFESCQGGPYASALLHNIVRTMREEGIRGVGQSSWGPTLFAFARSEDHAASVGETIQRRLPRLDADVITAEPCSLGAVISPLAE